MLFESSINHKMPNKSCMVRPFKMAVLLFSVHLLDQSLLYSRDYPVL